MKRGERNYELLYIECSRISCAKQKKQDDEIKLWREVNDGMYWLRKSYKPDKEQFGIIGIQVAGRTLYLNILIQDRADCHCYFHLYEAEVPVPPSFLLL